VQFLRYIILHCLWAAQSEILKIFTKIKINLHIHKKHQWGFALCSSCFTAEVNAEGNNALKSIVAIKAPESAHLYGNNVIRFYGLLGS